MNVRFIRVALSLVVLAGCYDTATENARDDAELAMDGGAMDEVSDAQVSIDAGAPELQAWIGLAQKRDAPGGLWFCAPDTVPQQHGRALLLLEVNADGELRAASLTIGEGESLPEVEDPDAYYPPDPPWTWHACPMSGLVAGFEYTAYEARLDQKRLSASIRPSEVIKPWCELQPSYPASPAAAAQWGEYLCRPTAQYTDVYQLSEAIPHSDDFSVWFPEELCFNRNASCTCDADSCTASSYRAMHLDLVVDGNIMTGRLAGMEIKLERQTLALP